MTDTSCLDDDMPRVESARAHAAAAAAARKLDCRFVLTSHKPVHEDVWARKSAPQLVLDI